MGERRKQSRLELRCEIQLRKIDDGRIVKTVTDNLSSEGFYCISDEPFSPGDLLECDLFVPAAGSSPSVNTVLHRRVRVVRVEIRGLEPGFGIACQFQDAG